MQLGSEIWWIENVNIRTGTVEKIEAGVVTLRTEKGLVTKRAENSLMMAVPVEPK